MAKPSLTAARARELLHYDPETGDVTRKVALCNTVKVGDKVGGLVGTGYLMAWCDGRLYLVHRLIFLLQTGEWPVHTVDHINAVRTDNRWSNLRDVPQGMNNQNRKNRNKKTHSHLPLGVTLVANSRKFASGIMVNRKRIFLGHFDTADEAHSAYVKAKRLHHPGGTL